MNTDHQNISDPGKNPFKVPDGYFRDLTFRINNRIITEQGQKKKIIHPAITWLAAASLAVLMVVASLYYFNNQDTNNIYTNYIESGYEDVDEMTLFRLAEEAAPTPSQEDNYTDSVIDYLIDEIDYLTILDEF